jgi:hypothetical protein
VSSRKTSISSEPIAFIAGLADGRTCLSFDREGEARLTLILPQAEAAKLVQRLPELMDTSFAVVCQPLKN